MRACLPGAAGAWDRETGPNESATPALGIVWLAPLTDLWDNYAQRISGAVLWPCFSPRSLRSVSL